MKKQVLIAATGMLMMAGMPMLAQAEGDNDRRSNFSSERHIQHAERHANKRSALKQHRSDKREAFKQHRSEKREAFKQRRSDKREAFKQRRSDKRTKMQGMRSDKRNHQH